MLKKAVRVRMILRGEWLVFQLNFSLSLWAYKTCVDVQPFDEFIDWDIYSQNKAVVEHFK